MLSANPTLRTSYGLLLFFLLILRPPSSTLFPYTTLFRSQVAVIMGDYLYSRAIIELVRLDDLEPLRVFARVTNAMTIGEMRQLERSEERRVGKECRSRWLPDH